MLSSNRLKYFDKLMSLRYNIRKRLIFIPHTSTVVNLIFKKIYEMRNKLLKSLNFS